MAKEQVIRVNCACTRPRSSLAVVAAFIWDEEPSPPWERTACRRGRDSVVTDVWLFTPSLVFGHGQAIIPAVDRDGGTRLFRTKKSSP